MAASLKFLAEFRGCETDEHEQSQHGATRSLEKKGHNFHDVKL
jgi:hypothetical protein